MKIICLTNYKIYDTVYDAVVDARLMNVSHSNISRCCRGEIPSAGKDEDGNRLQWAYFDMFLKHKDLPCIETEKKNWLLCITDNRLFTSSKEACEFYQIEPARISVQLAGLRPSAGFTKSGERLVFKRYSEVVKEWRNL